MSSETGAERKRMRPEDRRNAVLDAALTVFAEAGFRRASLSEVSDEAGVTKGCLYHYFDSKEALLLALMRERSQSASTICPTGGVTNSREDAVTLLVRSLWRRYENEGQLDLTTLALTELPHTPGVARAFFDEVVTRNRAFLRETLERAPGQRDSARAVSDDLVAVLIPYMVMGAALGYRLYHGIDPDERSSHEIEEALLRILLNGLRESVPK